MHIKFYITIPICNRYKSIYLIKFKVLNILIIMKQIYTHAIGLIPFHFGFINIDNLFHILLFFQYMYTYYGISTSRRCIFDRGHIFYIKIEYFWYASKSMTFIWICVIILKGWYTTQICIRDIRTSRGWYSSYYCFPRGSFKNRE